MKACGLLSVNYYLYIASKYPSYRRCSKITLTPCSIVRSIPSPNMTFNQLAFIKNQIKGNIISPLLQLVRMEASVNSNQHNGSASMILDITGGRVAVVDLGSTGCSIVCSSSPSTETVELERSLLLIVFCVSDLTSGLTKREATLPLFLTDDYNIWSV